MKQKHTVSRPWENERGSTLILVVLLTLILSASAIVALRNVARSTQGSAVFRTRAQAQMLSDSADRLFSDWVGNKASTLVDAMQKANYGEDDVSGTADVFGAGDNVDGQTMAEKRLGMAILGGELEFSQEDLTTGATPLITPNVDPDESGLFQVAPADKTFESRRKAKWRVKIRDMTDGMPAVGYSGSFCFKKALVAAEAQVGVTDPDWSRSNNVAQSRHGLDVMIGPIECGYN